MNTHSYRVHLRPAGWRGNAAGKRSSLGNSWDDGCQGLQLKKRKKESIPLCVDDRELFWDSSAFGRAGDDFRRLGEDLIWQRFSHCDLGFLKINTQRREQRAKMKQLVSSHSTQTKMSSLISENQDAEDGLVVKHVRLFIARSQLTRKSIRLRVRFISLLFSYL